MMKEAEAKPGDTLNTGESATEKSKYLHSMLTTLEKGSLRH